MIKNILVFIVNLPIFLLSKLIIRNPKVWVFGAWFGKNYSDNSKYLFEYVNKNCKDITAVWITNNNKTYDLVKKKGYKVVKTYSLAGYYYTLIAKYGFVSVHHIDINYYASLGMRIINLWHGIPLKKILKDDNVTGYNNCKKHPVYSKLRELLLQEYYSTIATSDAVAEIYKSAFNGLTKRVDIIGQPRCDAFYNNLENQDLYLEEDLTNIKSFQEQGKKIFVYMPTFRDTQKDISGWLKSDRLKQFLKDNNAVLVCKLHPYDKNSLNSDLGKEIYKMESNSDIYCVLKYSDALITDYSSVYLDFLILDKPILYYPIDLDEYQEKCRGFYGSYEELTAGLKAYNEIELINAMQDVIKGIDNYKGKRKILRDKVFKYQDGKNCERVVQWIRSLEKSQTFEECISSESVVDIINSLSEVSK